MINNKKILLIGMPDMALICLNKLVEAKLYIKAVILPDKTNTARETLANTAKKQQYSSFRIR